METELNLEIIHALHHNLVMKQKNIFLPQVIMEINQKHL